MPLPFIIGAIAVATAATGVAKGVSAYQKNSEAKEVNVQAQNIIENARKNADIARQNANKAINWLGQQRLETLQNEISRYITSFNKIHHIDIEYSNNWGGELKWKKECFLEMKELSEISLAMASGVIEGTIAGAITALGAYGGAMTFGAASTGTAIAALSGAAATNATLAFLGGGSLAAGGLGIAGGTMVLGGLVAGPALAVLGFTVNAKAEKNLEKAKSNLAEARKVAEDLATKAVICDKIRELANMYANVLWDLKSLLAPLTREMERIIFYNGTDFQRYSLEAQKTIVGGMAVFSAIAPIISTPIIEENGSINSKAITIVQVIRNIIPQLSK